MKKTITCGTFIFLENENKFLLGHSTGNPHFDIPKGLQDEGETYIETAIRECNEEFGIDLINHDLEFLGIFPYNSKKDIALFKCNIPFLENGLECLECTSMVEIEGRKPFKEIDYYNIFTLEDFLLNIPKSLKNCLILNNLIDKIKK